MKIAAKISLIIISLGFLSIAGLLTARAAGAGLIRQWATPTTTGDIRQTGAKIAVSSDGNVFAVGNTLTDFRVFKYASNGNLWWSNIYTGTDGKKNTNLAGKSP